MYISIATFSLGIEGFKNFSNCSYCPTGGLYKTLTRTLRSLSDKFSRLSFCHGKTRTEKQNCKEKQIMLLKTTVNWLFNDV